MLLGTLFLGFSHVYLNVYFINSSKYLDTHLLVKWLLWRLLCLMWLFSSYVHIYYFQAVMLSVKVLNYNFVCDVFSRCDIQDTRLPLSETTAYKAVISYVLEVVYL